MPECDSRANVDGTFKTPSLRNVEFTAPYFHNGGQLTLKQVVEFYNRGGDFREQNIDNLDPDIQALGLTDRDIAALVAFLKALTDDRVRFRQAPFDHPQLFVPDGHPDGSQGGKADDQLMEIPAVGRSGSAPLPRFLEEIRPLACRVPADGQEGAVELSWDMAAEATGYHVWHSRDQGGPYHKSTAAPVRGTSHVDGEPLPGTTYYYVVTDLDQAGSETAYTSEATCTTRPFLDLTAETRSRLASPVRGQVPLQAKAQSDIGIASVTFSVSGSSGVEATFAGVLSTTTGLYEATWDTTQVSDGTKTLTATAADSKGQGTLRTVSVLVDNTAPKVTVLKPRDGAVIVGNVEIEAAGDDGPVGSGIAAVEFDVDSAGNWRPLTLDTATGTWKGTWESTLGQHTIHVRATDRAGNQSTVTVSITVVTLPDTTIEVHLNGNLLGLLTVAVSGTVSLDVGITYQGSSVQGLAAVQYQIDGAGWQSLGQDPLTGTWEAVIGTTVLRNGTHALGILATDRAGNMLRKSYNIQVTNLL